MSNCKHCHQPQTAAPVICSECYDKLTAHLAAALALIDNINRIAFDGLHNGPYQDGEEAKIFSRIEELTWRGPQEAGEVEHD